MTCAATCKPRCSFLSDRVEAKAGLCRAYLFSQGADDMILSRVAGLLPCCTHRYLLGFDRRHFMKPLSRRKTSLPSWQSRGATPEARLPGARGGPSSALGGFHLVRNLTQGRGLQILNLQLVVGAKQRRAAFQNRFLVSPSLPYAELPRPSPSSSGGPAVDRVADRGSTDLGKGSGCCCCFRIIHAVSWCPLGHHVI